MNKTLILDGHLVDPSQGINGRRDILIENGQIVDIDKEIPARIAEHVIDAKGLSIFPGFVELHTHLREPGFEGSETIETGTRAAAHGGYTTIFCMPNTKPVCDSETGVQYVISRAESVGCVNVIPVACITLGMKGEELTDLGKLQKVGAGAFSDDGLPVMNAEIMRRALEYTSMLGVPIMEHCEDMNLTGEGVMNEGITSLKLGLKGIPRVSESIIVARDVALAAATGGHIHICHVSTRESVEAIREAKRNGVHVTAEVSPHHLTMTEEAVLEYNTHAKMKPPLCEEEDRDALIQALEDGTLDCIATDHAPHSATAKDNVFDAAPFGIIGMETAFPVLYTEFVATGRWPLEFLVEKMTSAPARVMNERWGTLKVGSPADLNLVRLDEPYTFELKHLGSKSVNCPWLGKKMKAEIAATLVNGNPAYISPEIFEGGIYSVRESSAETQKLNSPAKKKKKKTDSKKKKK